MSFAQGGGISLTPAQLRRKSHHPLDTPTPASTSGNNSTYITSLKPTSKSKSNNLSFDTSLSGQNVPPPTSRNNNNIGGGAGIKTNIRLSQQQQQQNYYRAPLQPATGRNGHDINTDDLDLDNLEIQTDNTERARRTLEEELQEGFRNLVQDSDKDSMGFGDFSDLENDDGGIAGMRNLRREMEDESLESSSSSDGIADDFSLHIGMTGIRRSGDNQGRPSVPIRRHSEEDTREMTYVTVDTPIISPRRPIPQHQQRQASNIPLPTSRESSAAPVEPTRRPLDSVDNFSSRQNQQRQQSKHTSTFPSYRSSPYDSIPSPQHKESEYTHRLPDITGITLGLQSPQATRKPSKPNESGDPEAAAYIEALNQLKSKLNGIQSENSAAGSRVRNLEESIRHERKSAENRNDREKEGNQMRNKLREEEEKGLSQQSQINRLKSQLANLTHTSEAQSASIESLRSQLHSKSHTDSALRGEVHAIRTGLESLGDEVAAVKSDVNELVREKHVGKEWEREERERKVGMEKERGRERDDRPRSRLEEVREVETSEDPDRTPRARGRTYRFAAPTSPANGTSFIPREEFNGYQTELDEQEKQARTSPTPRPRRTKVSYVDQNNRCTRQHVDSLPRRSSTAPLPSTHRSKQPTSAPPPPLRNQNSYETYINSNQFSSAEVPRHSREPIYRSSTSSEEENIDLDQRRRAERIFESVKEVRSGDGVKDNGMCTICKQRTREGLGSAPAKMQNEWKGNEGDDEFVGERRKGGNSKSNVRNSDNAERELINVLRSKEADFEQQKRLYLELSRTYEAMDAEVDGNKRRTLANHLKSSIDTLEIKADMVRGLHDLLHRQANASSPIRPSYSNSGRMGEGTI